MPLLSHVERHYNSISGRRAKQPNHRDVLMIRHNNIKRRCITFASRVARMDDAEDNRAKLVEGFRSTGEVPPVPSSSLTVLDLGCGRGGDLHKWNHTGTSMYIGVDISSESCAEARTRASRLDMPTRILNQPAVEFLESCPGGEFDVISMQFLLNYVADSEASLDRLMFLCARALKPSGVIIGTAVDSARVTEELTEGGKENDKNDYFSLTPIESQSAGLGELGYMYSFYMHNAVENCIEHVVPKEDLMRCASRHGLRMDYVIGFAETAHDDGLRLHAMQKRLTEMYFCFQMSRCV